MKVVVMNFKTFEGNSGDVWKYVFTKEDMVAEAVYISIIATMIEL